VISFLLSAAIAPGSGPADLDFWVGDWTMDGRSRTSFEKDEYTDGKCENTIAKVQDGKVIHENFRTTGFTGESWSVYNAPAKKWNQTWIDNSGSYLLFEGGKEGDNVVLKMTNAPKGSAARMVFTEIKPDSFTWNWEQSRDDGKTWILMWELKYKRKS
jgi:hypothetical protein